MAVMTGKITDTVLNSLIGFDRFLIRTYNPKKFAAVATALSRYPSWVCPTLVTLRGFTYADDPGICDSLRAQFISRILVDGWNVKTGEYFRGMTDSAFLAEKQVFKLFMASVGALHTAGVKMLAGTDFVNPSTYPGFSLADELELLVQAGLSNADALKTATIYPAEFLRISNRYGTVARGKIADLVLLDSNPLEKIGNARNIHSVILHGKFLSSAHLQASLEEVKKLNRELDQQKALFSGELN